MQVPATHQPGESSNHLDSSKDKVQKSIESLESKANLLLFRNSSLPNIKIKSPKRILEQFTHSLENSESNGSDVKLKYISKMSKIQNTLNLSISKSDVPITKLDIYNRFKFIQQKNKLHLQDRLNFA